MIDFFRYPSAPADIPSFGEAFRHYLLPEFRPAKPILSRSDYVITQGSCFAENLAKALGNEGIQANWLNVNEVMNSPLANRTYLEYALTDQAIAVANHEQALNLEAVRALKSEFIRASAFVFTAGLAYVKTGPNGEFYLVSVNDEPVGWRLTTVAENRTHIESIIALVRSVNPTIKIVISVSPIPMTRAPYGGSGIAADCRSKSILRAAVGEVMDLKIPYVYYWPSFEAIRWLGCHSGPVYGVEGTDMRHIGPSYLQEIMRAFVEYYFHPR